MTLKPEWLIILFLVALIIFSYTWHMSSRSTVFLEGQQKHQEDQAATSTPKKENEIIVLVWVWPWGVPFSLDRCQIEFNIPGCKLTANRSLYNVADALVIHHADIMSDRNLLPQKPRPHFQHWVWLNLEPPLIIENLHWLDGLFNMTMTFRKDSDIFRPYGEIVALKEPKNFTIPAKSKLVTWIVSRWYSTLPRNVYYKELRKHIKIDIYGAGHKPLSSYDLDSTVSQYKFYLAFENSIYKDYITEKLWSRAFGSWAVPVVFGTSRKNYEDYIPGDAFIHVDDFSSPKELADYLLQLDKDDEKYLKYFSWRSRYEVKVSPWTYHYCAACAMLKWGPKYQIAKNISKWFLNGL
ncbi:3-galactosyl-N-acetylglucosaminide 4-alpha-L-fucosyltransferase FUT3-like [Gastrophryne carolinensis]